METNRLSVRYAKALYLSARDQGMEDRVRKDMRLIAGMIRQTDLLKELIHSPVIPASRKQSVFGALLSGKVSPLVAAFIDLTIRKKREAYLPSMAINYEVIYKKEKNIIGAELITAVRMDKKIQGRIREMIEKNLHAKVEMTSHVEKGMIGGFLLRIEDRQIDATVTAQLKRMQQKLENIK